MKNQLGSNITYYVDNQATLHIEGLGPMPDFGTWEYAAPWTYSRIHYDKVVVGLGITTLGEYAFQGAKIKEITLPDSICEIGKHCFENCELLQTFVCPSQVTEIKSSVFKNCRSLKYVQLSNHIEQLWRWSFQNCENLRQINIPQSVWRISTTAFWGANLYACNFDTKRYVVENACLYDLERKKLVTASQNQEEIVVRDGIEIIGDYSFYDNKKIRKVVFPASVKLIDKKAFSRCSALQEILLKGKKPVLEDNALYRCDKVRFSESENRSTQRYKTLNGKIAVTRHDYAVLIDGRVDYYPSEYSRLDITPLLAYTDFVDIKGGFDFIVGLRQNGTVVAACSLEKNDGLLSSYQGYGFPKLSDWHNISTITATEGRIAGLQSDGTLVHCSKYYEQVKATRFHSKYRHVAAHFEGLLAIAWNGDLVALPEDDYTLDIIENFKSLKKLEKADFKAVYCNGYYYSPLTTAVLTKAGHVFWDFNGNGCKKLPADSVVNVSVCDGKIVVITSDGTLYYSDWGNPQRAIKICENVVAAEVMFGDGVVVLSEDGKIHKVNCASFCS